MSANGYLIDAATRHQVFLQRFAGGQVKLTLPILKRMAAEIRAALSSQDLTSFQTARLTALQLEITAITKAAGVKMEATITPSLTELAVYESQFTQKMLQGAVTVSVAGLAPTLVTQAVLTKPLKLVSGQKTTITTMAGLYDTFAAGAAAEVMTAVNAGMIAGRTTQQITAEVMGMVNSRSRRQAEAVVRTATNHAGNVARAETYRANADIIAKEEFVATLDGATTITCASLDGNQYPVGEGPQPAMHYGCRSVRVPVLDPAFAALREGATRASMTGPVSAQTTYGGFLKRQSAEFQEEVLGVERAKLFRSGKVSIDRFTDDSGKVYTLEQLAAREGLTLD